MPLKSSNCSANCFNPRGCQLVVDRQKRECLNNMRLVTILLALVYLAIFSLSEKQNELSFSHMLLVVFPKRKTSRCEKPTMATYKPHQNLFKMTPFLSGILLWEDLKNRIMNIMTRQQPNYVWHSSLCWRSISTWKKMCCD